MAKKSGADRALAATPSSPQAVSPLTGIDHGYEEWRPALIAYWQHEQCGERANGLKRGDPLDYLDTRAIEAIEAALAALREAA